MSDRVWVGQNAMSLETAPAFEAYTGVILWYDDENAFKAGDDTGRVLEVDCPWATQEMADNILASIAGYAYRPYEAAGAILDPAAELGDGVTVGGVYGQLAAINTSFDPLMASDISAPGEEEIDHEYPYESPQARAMARKVTLGMDYFGVRISKANGLEIHQEDTEGNQKSRMILNSDLMAFYNDDGSEALYFDVEAGKFKFAGDVAITGGTMNINDNFIVDEEGNVTLNGNIILSGGAITWGDNNPKTTISYLYSASADGSDPHEEMKDTDYYRCDVIDGVQTAWYKFRGEDGSDADVPSYIERTYIDATTIKSPTIEGNDVIARTAFKVTPVGTDGDGDEVEVPCGSMGLAFGKTLDENGDPVTTYGVALASASTSVDANGAITVASNGYYVIVTNEGVRLQAGDTRLYVTDKGAFYNGVELGVGTGGVAVFG